MLSAALPAAPAAGTVSGQAAGSISATVRVDFPQRLEEIQKRSVQVEIFRDGSDLGGLPLGGGNWPGYLDFTVENLPQGEYTLEFTGEGYVPYTQRLTLGDCSQHVTLGTGDGTFTLGDVDGDGFVDRRDR